MDIISSFNLLHNIVVVVAVVFADSDFFQDVFLEELWCGRGEGRAVVGITIIYYTVELLQGCVEQGTYKPYPGYLPGYYIP